MAQNIAKGCALANLWRSFDMLLPSCGSHKQAPLSSCRKLSSISPVSSVSLHTRCQYSTRCSSYGSGCCSISAHTSFGWCLVRATKAFSTPDLARGTSHNCSAKRLPFTRSGIAWNSSEPFCCMKNFKTTLAPIVELCSGSRSDCNKVLLQNKGSFMLA